MPDTCLHLHHEFNKLLSLNIGRKFMAILKRNRPHKVASSYMLTWQLKTPCKCVNHQQQLLCQYQHQLRQLAVRFCAPVDIGYHPHVTNFDKILQHRIKEFGVPFLHFAHHTLPFNIFRRSAGPNFPDRDFFNFSKVMNLQLNVLLQPSPSQVIEYNRAETKNPNKNTKILYKILLDPPMKTSFCFSIKCGVFVLL